MANSQLSRVAAVCNVRFGKTGPIFFSQRGFSTVARTALFANGSYDLTMDRETFGELHIEELAILVSSNIQEPDSGTKFYTINWEIVNTTTLRIKIQQGQGEVIHYADADFCVVIYRTN